MVFHFFFSSRRRHTRFDCDWSSDVCSSDLRDGDRRDQGAGGTPVRQVRTALDVPRPSDGSVSARRVLAVLAVAELLAMAPWFSASAVAPTLSDRKSTRLNSSHSQISYAVFCLKKKKIK